ncbi:MAG: glucose-1-phosphate adenylyltransferase [Leptospiraceae bacterium]|nr:glucose-1-phosphate adenylyltransferase [Leptospiraceae bacterium]MDW8306435.1 glucose-1-phosphate adenylyltransferase [Leptospiraceae bacterium]
MQNIIALILGGGKGTRLYPLTKYRSKPAVPLAGQYRIIDIPISNCINSGIRRMFVITQFNSKSLNHHINHTYRFDIYGGMFVDILAAEQTMESQDWYQGTADAVRRNIRYLEDYADCDLVLILSGDQLYRMDFSKLVAVHRESQAEMTLACLPVTEQKATGFGILKVAQRDNAMRIVDFVEKPKDESRLKYLACTREELEALGFHDPERNYLASMGIYLFDKKVLIEELRKDKSEDFGQHVIPKLITTRRVSPFLFNGYWEDIGTIASFHQANLALVAENPPFKLYTPEAPLYTNPRFLPPAYLDGCDIDKALIADGAIVMGGFLRNSIVGLRTLIQRNVTLQNTVVLGADYYEPLELRSPKAGHIPMGIGEHSIIKNAIIDKNARIGRHVRLENLKKLDYFDDPKCPGVYIRDGIIVIEKNATVPDFYEL